MITVNFNVSKEDAALINEIVKRWIRMCDNNGRRADRLSAHMDVTACHANGCALNLVKLLGASDANFAHDMGGIARHLNRETGKLMNNFIPRYAAWDVMRVKK